MPAVIFNFFFIGCFHQGKFLEWVHVIAQAGSWRDGSTSGISQGKAAWHGDCFSRTAAGYQPEPEGRAKAAPEMGVYLNKNPLIS